MTTLFFPFTVYFWEGHVSSLQLLLRVVVEDSNWIQPPLFSQAQGEQMSLLPSSLEQQTPFPLITLVAFYWTSSIWPISPLYWGTKLDTVSPNAASKVANGGEGGNNHFLWAASYALANTIQHADSTQHTSMQYSSKQGPSYQQRPTIIWTKHEISLGPQFALAIMYPQPAVVQKLVSKP